MLQGLAEQFFFLMKVKYKSERFMGGRAYTSAPSSPRLHKWCLSWNRWFSRAKWSWLGIHLDLGTQGFLLTFKSMNVLSTGVRRIVEQTSSPRF